MLDEKFDIVFTSYGVLYWLPDISKWGETVSRFLKPGGTFYIVEFHPFIHIFEPTEDKLSIEARFSYFQDGKPLVFEPDGEGSYADNAAEVTTTEYGWGHSLSDIINSLVSNGLYIEFIHEFPYCNYQRFPVMEQGDDGRWRLPENIPALPMMFSLKATK